MSIINNTALRISHEFENYQELELRLSFKNSSSKSWHIVLYFKECYEHWPILDRRYPNLNYHYQSMKRIGPLQNHLFTNLWTHCFYQAQTVLTRIKPQVQKFSIPNRGDESGYTVRYTWKRILICDGLIISGILTVDRYYSLLCAPPWVSMFINRIFRQ